MADAATFTIYMSATAGQSPHELSYLGAPARRRQRRARDGGLDGFRALMKRLRIGRAKGRWKNWCWEPNEADRAEMSDLLYKGPAAIGLRRRPEDIAGWPEVQRELAPIALDREARRLYDATWREFRRELGLAGGSTRKPQGWAADLRFRQKASLLRIPGTADFVAGPARRRPAGRHLGRVPRDQRHAGRDAARPRLGGRRDQRRAIGRRERGDPRRLPDRRARRGDLHGHRDHLAAPRRDAGRRAGALPASCTTCATAPSSSPQIEGRCHRDGQRALIYYAYAEDTVEETIAATVDRAHGRDGRHGGRRHQPARRDRGDHRPIRRVTAGLPRPP